MITIDNRERLYLYSDAAYHCCFGVMAPFNTRRGQSVDEDRFNTTLSRMRISVEHAFGDAWRQWTYTTTHKQLRIGCQAVGAFYAVAVLLNNCRTCLRGRNQTSDCFEVDPPSIYQYLYPNEAL